MSSFPEGISTGMLQYGEVEEDRSRQGYKISSGIR